MASLLQRCCSLFRDSGQETTAISTSASLGASRELSLLAAATRLRLDPDDRARVAAIVDAGVDWARVLHLARENRVDALLQHGLAQAIPDAVPPEVARRLADYRAANLTRNQRRAELLAGFAADLTAAGIPFLAFKGPVLASQIYGDLGLRFFWDLDVLVAPRDLARASALIEGRGLRQPVELSARESRFLSRYHWALAFEHPGGELEVDLHWRLFPPNFAMSLRERDMWSRAVPCTIGAQSLPTLAPEDALLYLAVHGAKEEWRRLQMLCDVAELLRARPEIFDGDVLARATAQGAGRMLLLAAALAHAALGAPLSDRVRAAIAADPAIPQLERHVWRALDDSSLRSSVFSLTRFRRLAHARRRDQARYVLRTATRPRWGDVCALPMPYALRAAYVPLRILDAWVLPAWRRIRPGAGRPAA